MVRFIFATALSTTAFLAAKAIIKAAATAKPGEIVKIAAAVKTSAGKAGHHVFHMTVKTPDGKTSWYLRQTQETSNGKAVFELPFALNDAAGNYEITITDAATKTAAKFRISCKQ